MRILMTDTVNMTDSKLMTSAIIIIIIIIMKNKKKKKKKNHSSVIPEKRSSLLFKCKFKACLLQTLGGLLSGPLCIRGTKHCGRFLSGPQP